jgi:hypothetical protein
MYLYIYICIYIWICIFIVTATATVRDTSIPMGMVFTGSGGPVVADGVRVYVCVKRNICTGDVFAYTYVYAYVYA